MYRISWPNRISIARIVLVGPFVVMLLHLQDPEWGTAARRAALIIYALMAISDGLDGYLARRLHAESAVGRFLDPLADKILGFFSVILLAREGTHVTGMRLPDVVAVILIGKDLVIVTGFCIIYFATSRVFIQPQRVGKWCTTLQLLMIIAILVSPELPARLSSVPVVLWWTTSALAVATVIHYFRVGHHFVVRHETSQVQSARGKDGHG